MGSEMPKRTGEELDLFELARVLWVGKWRIALVTIVFAVAALIYILNARHLFQADSVLMQSSQKGISGGLSQLGGLASLAGIRIPSESNSEFPLAVLRSRDFAAQFVEAANIDAALVSEGFLKPRPAIEAAAHDSISDATGYFRDQILTISEDKKQGLVTVSMKWTQPDVAAIWANEFVALLNDRLRARAMEEAEQNVSYLRQVLSESNVSALQQSIGRVLEEEMQKLLLAKANGEYAFRVIDRAVAPKERTSPRTVFILFLGTLLGFALGVTVVLVPHLVTIRRPIR